MKRLVSCKPQKYTHRRKSATVLNAGPECAQALQMKRGAVTLVPVKAITRKSFVHPHQIGITCGLGQDARRGRWLPSTSANSAQIGNDSTARFMASNVA